MLLNVVFLKDLLLGPLLFIIYVNHICNNLTMLFNIMYADDNSVILSDKNRIDLICLLNKELQCTLYLDKIKEIVS